MNQEAQALADEIKRLARHLQAAAFSHGYEDAHPSTAWSRQEKAAKVSADKLGAVSQAIDRLAAMAQPPAGWVMVPVEPTHNMIEAGEAQPVAREYAGVSCMCVVTGCRAGPGCPHYSSHCKKHIAALSGEQP